MVLRVLTERALWVARELLPVLGQIFGFRFLFRDLPSNFRSQWTGGSGARKAPTSQSSDPCEELGPLNGVPQPWGTGGGKLTEGPGHTVGAIHFAAYDDSPVSTSKLQFGEAVETCAGVSCRDPQRRWAPNLSRKVCCRLMHLLFQNVYSFHFIS